MKLEIEIPDSAIINAIQQAALDALMVNRGFNGERLSSAIGKIVAERTHEAFLRIDLTEMISNVIARCAQSTLEEEVRKIVAKMARDAVKAEMAKQDKLL